MGRVRAQERPRACVTRERVASVVSVRAGRARACALSLFLGMLLLLFEDKTEINYISVAMRGAPDLSLEPHMAFAKAWARVGYI